MNKRKERAKAFRRNLKIWIAVSQVLGLIGALSLGLFLGSGFEGYLWGYGTGGVCEPWGYVGLVVENVGEAMLFRLPFLWSVTTL